MGTTSYWTQECLSPQRVCWKLQEPDSGRYSSKLKYQDCYLKFFSDNGTYTCIAANVTADFVLTVKPIEESLLTTEIPVPEEEDDDLIVISFRNRSDDQEPDRAVMTMGIMDDIIYSNPQQESSASEDLSHEANQTSPHSSA